MFRNSHCVRLVLGALAISTLAVGCSREPKPAQQPRASTSPPFEARMEQGRVEQGERRTMGMDQKGREQTTGQGQQAQVEGVNTIEVELCDDLRQNANFTVKDVPGGVSIIARPKAGHNLSAVREAAQRIDRKVQEGVEHGKSAPANVICDLFAFTRNGAVMSVSEDPNAVRILFTTTDKDYQKTLRKSAREWVKHKEEKTGETNIR